MSKNKNLIASLPDVFTFKNFAYKSGRASRTPDRQEADKSYVRTSLARARKAGWIASVGPRLPIYYNLLVAPNGPSTLVAKAIATLYPDALIVGSTAINHANLTTQVPHLVTFAATKTQQGGRLRYIPEIYGAKGVVRTESWRLLMREFITHDDSNYLERLSGEAAIVDQYIHDDIWKPDPDDLDVEDLNVQEIHNVYNKFEQNVDPILLDAIENVRQHGFISPF